MGLRLAIQFLAVWSDKDRQRAILLTSGLALKINQVSAGGGKFMVLFARSTAIRIHMHTQAANARTYVASKKDFLCNWLGLAVSSQGGGGRQR